VTVGQLHDHMLDALPASLGERFEMRSGDAATLFGITLDGGVGEAGTGAEDESESGTDGDSEAGGDGAAADGADESDLDDSIVVSAYREYVSPGWNDFTKGPAFTVGIYAFRLSSAALVDEFMEQLRAEGDEP